MGDSCKTQKSGRILIGSDLIFLEFYDPLIFVFLLTAIFSFRFDEYENAQDSELE